MPPFGYHDFIVMGFPIRKSSDQRLCAPPRSLSQLITSFIASESQGIRHAPLLAFKKCSNFKKIEIQLKQDVKELFPTNSEQWISTGIEPVSRKYRAPSEQSIHMSNKSTTVAVVSLRCIRIRIWPVGRGGEYRSRTDDLLRARQAL